MSLPNGLGAGGRGKEKAPCRYLHFELDWDGGDGEFVQSPIIQSRRHKLGIGLGPSGRETPLVRMPRCFNMMFSNTEQLPPQWLNCDLRRFDYSVLGKFHVIMADPPWDIHMSVCFPSRSQA